MPEFSRLDNMRQPINELIVIQRHPKAGTALLVEQGVQAMLDNPAAVDGSFDKLSRQLPDPDVVPPGSDAQIERRYVRAERGRQLAGSTVIALIGAAALPTMTAHVREHGTLLIDDYEPYDPGAFVDLGPQTMQTYRANRASKHLVDAGEKVLRDIETPNHPYHGLGMHLRDAMEEYFDAWTAWHEGPGANRWPSHIGVREPNARHLLLGALCINVQLSTSVCAARAVHHLIHENPNAGPEELDAAIAISLPQMLWSLSADRHLSWSRDWRERHARGESLSFVPEDGALALLQPRDKIITPNRYAASVEGLSIMTQPDFCPHPLLKNGPVAKAGSCAADPWIRYANPADDQAARRFFEVMGYRLADGSFNIGAVTLAMGRRLVAEAILPAMRAKTYA